MKKCPQAYLTDKEHIQFNKPMDYRKVRPRVRVDYDTSFRNDKNNVDIEKEVTDAVNNTLLFKALATSIKNNYRMLNSVLT
jgi:flagellar basal-body rod protein FlgB